MAATLTAPLPIYRPPASLLEPDPLGQHRLAKYRSAVAVKATVVQTPSPTVSATYTTWFRTDDRLSELNLAFKDALEEVSSLVKAGELEQPNRITWCLAFQALRGFFSEPFASRLDTPLISPMRHGALSAEWHRNGLNIELRFRGPNDIYVVIEDAYSELASYQGRDPELSKAAEAINKLAARSH